MIHGVVAVAVRVRVNPHVAKWLWDGISGGFNGKSKDLNGIFIMNKWDDWELILIKSPISSKSMGFNMI